MPPSHLDSEEGFDPAHPVAHAVGDLVSLAEGGKDRTGGVYKGACQVSLTFLVIGCFEPDKGRRVVPGPLGTPLGVDLDLLVGEGYIELSGGGVF